MSPFNYRGPEFLVFYLVLSVTAGLLAWVLRRQWDPKSTANELPQDPYLLAFLCGGRGHLLRVAMLSLIDRELLQAKGDAVRTAGVSSLDKAPRPLDRAILEKYLSPGKAGEVFQNASVLAVATDYEQQLVDLGFVPDRALKNRRLLLFFALALPLLALGVTKMVVAVSRGHANIGFLIVLSILSVIVIYKICTPFRTSAGAGAVGHLKEFFQDLKPRGKSLRWHAPTNELVFLAAVFGMAALPTAVVSVLQPMKLYRESTVGSSCGSGCGSSCGSGSSCGGGGCGGGCGGCGG